MYYKQLVLLTALCFSLFSGFSQTREIDSLTIKLAFQNQDSLKIDTSIALINSLLKQKEYTKVIRYLNESEKLAKHLNYSKGLADINFVRAQIYAKNGDYKNVINSYRKSLLFYSQSKDSLGLANVYKNLGALYIEYGDYSQGLDYSISAVKVFLSGLPPCFEALKSH